MLCHTVTAISTLFANYNLHDKNLKYHLESRWNFPFFAMLIIHKYEIENFGKSIANISKYFT